MKIDILEDNDLDRREIFGVRRGKNSERIEGKERKESEEDEMEIILRMDREIEVEKMD